MRDLLKCTGITLALFLIASVAWGHDFGMNITIWDGLSTGTGAYGPQEDNEVEIGNLATQGWDLEGFFQKQNKLTMVGGFDFINGAADPYYPQYGGRLPRYHSGDIFLSTSGRPSFGPNSSPSLGENAIVKNVNGYNYVIDLDFATKSYAVYAIDSDTEVKVSWFASNYETNPWIYWAGGTYLSSGSMIFDGYDANGIPMPLSDVQIGNGLLGDAHFGVTVDLSFLQTGTDFYAHFTQQCGNDNLMGFGSIVTPEPATLLMVGTGLLGLGYCGRKRLRQRNASIGEPIQVSVELEGLIIPVKPEFPPGADPAHKGV